MYEPYIKRTFYTRSLTNLILYYRLFYALPFLLLCFFYASSLLLIPPKQEAKNRQIIDIQLIAFHA
jgi:hypothetical protein